jgi:hypothetical protein
MRTDRQDEANSRFSQFCERVQNQQWGCLKYHNVQTKFRENRLSVGTHTHTHIYTHTHIRTHAYQDLMAILQAFYFPTGIQISLCSKFD